LHFALELRALLSPSLGGAEAGGPTRPPAGGYAATVGPRKARQTGALAPHRGYVDVLVTGSRAESSRSDEERSTLAQLAFAAMLQVLANDGLALLVHFRYYADDKRLWMVTWWTMLVSLTLGLYGVYTAFARRVTPRLLSRPCAETADERAAAFASRLARYQHLCSALGAPHCRCSDRVISLAERLYGALCVGDRASEAHCGARSRPSRVHHRPRLPTSSHAPGSEDSPHGAAY
jgi:hypothetical protein